MGVLALIREAVEDCARPGSVGNSEHPIRMRGTMATR